MLKETYNYEIYAVVNKDKDGNILSGLPIAKIDSWITGRRLVSLPFTDYCPIVEPTVEGNKLLISKLMEFSSEIRAQYIELRTGTLEIPMEAGASFVQHRLLLDKIPDLLFKEFDQKSVQWGIKKAQKMEVETEFTTDVASIRRFIELNAATRKKHFVLPQPDRFFHKMRDILFVNDLGFIVQAKVHGKIIASSIFLHLNGAFFYKYNASDPHFLKYQPNNLILWDAIKFATSKEGKSFDFGRSELSNKGLVDFKKRWATEEAKLDYSMFPKVMTYTSQSSNNSWKARAVVLVSTLLPPRACRTIGGILYRHIG